MSITTRLMNKLLFFVSGFLPVYVIEIGGRPYLERYRVGRILGRRIYLHRFVRQDGERHLHDHPWRSLCLVLAGGYVEERLECFSPNVGLVASPRWVRWINIITQRTFHRIATVKQGTWTLMFAGRRIGMVRGFSRLGHTSWAAEKGWGFLDAKEDVVGSKKYTLTYEQPYAGKRSDDFLDNTVTGREYRQQQSSAMASHLITDDELTGIIRYHPDEEIGI